MNHIDIEQIPFIGQIVHFWPDPSQKFAAIVTETFPPDRDTGGDLARPIVALKVFEPGGDTTFFPSVHPLDIESLPDTFENVWTFTNEFATLQTDEDADDDKMPGTKANFWVGEDISC